MAFCMIGKVGGNLLFLFDTKGLLLTVAGAIFFVTACAALFVGVQVMFEIRESEKRRGVFLKC